jgi:hypothetical protein
MVFANWTKLAKTAPTTALAAGEKPNVGTEFVNLLKEKTVFPVQLTVLANRKVSRANNFAVVMKLAAKTNGVMVRAIHAVTLHLNLTAVATTPAKEPRIATIVASIVQRHPVLMVPATPVKISVAARMTVEHLHLLKLIAPTV